MRLHSSVMVLGMLLGASSVPVCAATFEVPNNFEIMYVDLESTGTFGNDFKADVEAGEHQFVVRFNQRIGGGSDVEQFQSEPYIIDVHMAKESDIALEAPHFFKKRDAERYAKSPEFTLVDNGRDGELLYEIHPLPKKSGFQPMRDYKEEVRQFTATYKRPKTDAPTPALDKAPMTEELEMLKFWYNKAEARTRKDMRIWMVDASYQAQQTNNAFEMLTFWFQKASPKDQKAFQIWLLSE